LGTRDFWGQAQLEGDRATTAIWELEIFWWQVLLQSRFFGWQAQLKNDRATTVIENSFYLGFFCLDAAWLNEGRCPGGRPSVS